MKNIVIKNYLNLTAEEQTRELLDKVYNLTNQLEKDYPKHREWFYDKFIKGFEDKTRNIIYCLDNDIIVGVACLKKSLDEKKICTIYIDEEYRNNGIGTKLLEESFKYLETSKPLITMPSYKEECFKEIIKKYNWQKTQEIEKYYSINNEIVFNGNLI